MFRLTASVAMALSCLCAYPGAANSAEIRGTVVMEYQGLFESDNRASTHPVSVALLPGENQRVVRRAPGRQQIEIVGNRMQPAFLTVQKGGQVEFINRDPVFHELFSLSPGEPVSARLGKAGGNEHARVSFRLDQAQTMHFFCRIHNKSYARIDVVDTPYLDMVQPGHQFHFTGLAPGGWKLRLASPAAETAWIPVTAMTMPPPLELKLTSRNGGRAGGKLKPHAGITQLYQQQAH